MSRYYYYWRYGKWNLAGYFDSNTVDRPPALSKNEAAVCVDESFGRKTWGWLRSGHTAAQYDKFVEQFGFTRDQINIWKE